MPRRNARTLPFLVAFAALFAVGCPKSTPPVPQIDTGPADPDAGPIDLFYCVTSRSAAAHLDELEALAARHDTLRLHVVASEEGARLSAEQIARIAGPDLSATQVAFCGPVSLRRSLQPALRRLGVPPRRFHDEAFEFRTGIGLKRLAGWVLTRQSTNARAARS